MNDRDPRNAAARPALSRRGFIRTTAAAGTAFAAASIFGGQPPAFAQSRKLHYLQWSSFIPDADTEIRRQADEFKKASGVDVTVEFINQNDMTPRITSAIESGGGADVMLLIENQPLLFAKGLADHNGLMEELAGSDVYDWARGSVEDDGVARAVPLFNVPNAIVYRKDVFEELGLAPPQTLDEYLEAGRTLKNNNWPVGQTLGHTFGDAPTFAYPLLWSFGGQEVSESGEGVLDSPETIAALEYMAEFWEAACDPGGFAWDDGSNNRAFLGQTIAATLNGASIYFVARQEEDKYPGLADKLGHINNPEGPSGRYHCVAPRSPAIMAYSREQEAAGEFIRFLFQEENFSRFMTVNNGYVQGLTPKWETHSVWSSDPAIEVFGSNARYGRSYGYAGPGNRASGEVKEKYIIVDMLARAARGEPAKEVAAWAHKELVNAYG